MLEIRELMNNSNEKMYTSFESNEAHYKNVVGFSIFVKLYIGLLMMNLTLIW